MTTATRRPVVLRLITAFVIGFVSLTLEIAYTRIVSFKLFYYYTYFVIGLALLGLGAAGAFVALSRRLRSVDTVRLVQRVAPIAGGIGVAAYAVVARLATDVNLIWSGSFAQAAWQLILLVVLSVCITAAFFCVGVLFASLVVSQATEMRRLYFWDLAGAAGGCLLAVPLESTIGPPAMVLVSLVVLAFLGLGMVLADGGKWLATAGAVAAVALLALAAGQLRVRADATKNLKDTDTIEAGSWGAMSRVDVVALGDLKVLHHDGLWGSAIWRYDGTRATTARFDDDVAQVPFAALGPDAGPSVLIIGAAGGNEIMASLTFGASHVDAIEPNPITVDLMRNEYAAYSGHIVDDPRVRYMQGDGRTFLARSDREYDLIWFVAPDSYAASSSATSGAFVLSEGYLYTQQMLETAFDHLTPRGAIVAQFGDFAPDRPPTRTARYLVTAREALAERIDQFDRHVALVVDDGGLENVNRVSTIMLFASPTTDEATARIRDALSVVPQSKAQYLPGVVRLPGVNSDIITVSDAELEVLVDEYPFQISAIDDDRPFFWHFTSFGTVLTDWSRDFDDNEIAVGERLLLVLLAVAALLAAVCLWLPFRLTRLRGAAVRVQGRGRLFGYFAALGMGFMLIEISMIQRFTLLLGFPTLSLPVSLFTLLIATAVGARVSPVIKRWPVGGLPAVTGALVLLSLVYMSVASGITDAALAWGQGARIATVVLLLFPIGLLLGVFLPTGIDAALDAAGTDEAVRGRLVAWCWAVNGFFSVIGSSATTILSMAAGFNQTLLIGLSMYVAAVVLQLLVQSNEEEDDLADELSPRPALSAADG